MFQQAEQILLNEEVGVIPINWYLGDYAFNPETLAELPRSRLRPDLLEQITVTK